MFDNLLNVSKKCLVLFGMILYKVLRTESNRKENKLNAFNKDQELFRQTRDELKSLVY